MKSKQYWTRLKNVKSKKLSIKVPCLPARFLASFGKYRFHTGNTISRKPANGLAR